MLLGMAIPCGNAARADDATAWDGDARSAVRLHAGTRNSSDGAALRAGIEIRLKPGWHTYWRYPGDAGVPPRFDFSGSQNLKSVEVLWPAPRRLDEAGLSTIGYDHDLILPLRVIALDDKKPVALRVKLAYAICEKLCVPAESNVALSLAGGPSTQEARLAAAEVTVPRKAALGADVMLGIRAVRRAAFPHGMAIPSNINKTPAADRGTKPCLVMSPGCRCEMPVAPLNSS
jgi:DsbC/DsbD-like thiol-disulfide interchange protein